MSTSKISLSIIKDPWKIKPTAKITLITLILEGATLSVKSTTIILLLKHKTIL